MKNKKPVSLVLSLVIALSCCVVAFADDGNYGNNKEGVFVYDVSYLPQIDDYAAYIENVDPSATGEITIPTIINNSGKELCVIYVGGYAFNDCYGVTKIIVSSDNIYYSSDSNGVLFNKDKTELVRCPVGTTMTEYTIPSTVKRIVYDAFYQCSNLKSVTIPNSVEIINAHSFSDCTNLKTIYYTGTKEEWESIDNDADLTGITVVYDATEEPSDTGSDSGILGLFGNFFETLISIPSLIFSFLLAIFGI